MPDHYNNNTDIPIQSSASCYNAESTSSSNFNNSNLSSEASEFVPRQKQQKTDTISLSTSNVHDEFNNTSKYTGAIKKKSESNSQRPARRENNRPKLENSSETRNNQYNKNNSKFFSNNERSQNANWRDQPPRQHDENNHKPTTRNSNNNLKPRTENGTNGSNSENIEKLLASGRKYSTPKSSSNSIGPRGNARKFYQDEKEFDRGTTKYHDNNRNSYHEQGNRSNRDGVKNAPYDNWNNEDKERPASRSNRRFDPQVNNENRNRNGRDYERFNNHNTNDSKNNRFYNDEPIRRNTKKMSEKTKKEKMEEATKISQRDRLIKEIESGKLECMICCEIIGPTNSTWSCSNCFHILHINCIKKWALTSKSDTGEWRCVACQSLSTKMPRDYYCFCGKVKEPVFNRVELAHSCGNMCNRTDNCVHPCTLLCHPGPHIVCQSSVQRFCGCGKTSRTFQCSMKDTFCCEEVCDKLLNCGVHKCKEKCHHTDCSPCEDTIELICYCGKETKETPCNADNAFRTHFSCDKSCDRPLSCGNHNCKSSCHSGECGGCELSPNAILSCPCGRTPIKNGERMTCLDAVPLCKGTCGKQLNCGPLAAPHTCPSKCHLEACPPCLKSSNIKCRCGRIEEKIQCKNLAIDKDVRCKKKCVKLRYCGKHKCNQECCIEQEHFCNQTCNRQLNCKKHKCDKKCHVGNCNSCPRVSFDELTCECGKEIIYPPVPCGTKTPVCTNPCKRKHSCAHDVRHPCHSDPDCPPCVFLTAKLCYGKHEERRTIPCNQASFSCGMPCAEPLSCQRHNCIRSCHEDACEKPKEVCKQKCTKKRTDCEHPCNAPCHSGDCPETMCKEQIEVQCECGNLKILRFCEQETNEYRRMFNMKMAMQMQEMQEGGNTMDIMDLYGNKSKKNFKTLECNDDCKTVERNRRLDIAFKVENPHLITYPKFTPNYSEFLRTFYKKDSSFVNGVHDKLTELVKLAKESKQKFRSHQFPVMNRDKRHVVHDLAELFGVESVAYDAEPKRNVVCTAERETCWLPSLSLLEVIQRESGMPVRKPPPNLIKK